MSLRNPVRDLTASLHVEVLHGTAFELLIGLFASSMPDQPRDESWAPEAHPALRSLGERSGELWLHLLGLALELPDPQAAALVAAVEDADPVELRRHLVGVHVPAWQRLLGKAALERAARGDAQDLLEHQRYYGGRARESLSVLLPLSPEETKERLVTALRSYADEVLAPHEADLRRRLAQDVRRRAGLSGHELIDAAAGGYVYEAEPELDRVVLVPHLAARPWLLLCQHENTRLICYAAAESETDPDRLLKLGRALGDAKRIALLERLRDGDATLGELAGEVGLAKSTTHHHLGQLRAAGLIVLRGNAAGYSYSLDRWGFGEAERLLAAFPNG